MESHARLDSLGAAAARQLTPILLLFFFLAGCPTIATAQTAFSSDQEVSRVKQLYDEARWTDVVRAVPGLDTANADLLLYRGLALAKLERWDEARTTLEAGITRDPRDARFSVELGGIAYRLSQFSLAKRELRLALRIQPKDSYTNNFLASIYFLEGNLEAALKYWNRTSQPKLSDLRFEPQPRVNPLTLDRAVPFSPGSVWLREQYLASQTQLDALGLYPSAYFDLMARPDSTYDLTIRAPERYGWGTTKLESAVSLLRGLPYFTIFPEFYDLGHGGHNWRSLVRWVDQRRRFFSELSGPIEDRPDLRYRVYFDARNENWDLTNTLAPSNPAPSGLNLEKAAAGAEVQFLPSERWSWNTGFEYSYRRFRSLDSIPTSAASFFTNGSSLALHATVNRWLVRYPERRFTLDSSASVELGTFFENPLGRFTRAQGSLTAQWFPMARGDDNELQAGITAGKTFGQVPFDELFKLGFERDNDLLLRGHPDLIDGQKGNAPLGRNFVLWNSEFDKIAYSNGLIRVRLGPFLDTGRIYDPSGYFGTRTWLWDTGLQAKIRILGSVEFVLGYGKDLRTGTNSFFTTVSR